MHFEWLFLFWQDGWNALYLASIANNDVIVSCLLDAMAAIDIKAMVSHVTKLL